MPLLNYTTSIDAAKTIGELSAILARHGAQFITVGYDAQRNPSGIAFVFPVNGTPCNFKLPTQIDGVLKVMRADRKVPRSKCTPEQAARVGWRIVKDWVAAQMAFIEAGQSRMEQVFLPYALLNDGTTLFDAVTRSPLLLSAGPPRA